MSAERFEIAVVGGGPVGAAAALALRGAGFDTALVERAPAPPAWDAANYDARVYALAPSSQAVLAGLGAWETIAAARTCAYTRMKIWERDPQTALAFEAADANRGELGWIVEHALLVDTLWRRLDQAICRTQTSLDGIELGVDGATLRLHGGGWLRAQLIVAADGADSQLRRLAGIDTVNWRYGQRAIVCHVRTARAHRATAWQRFLKTGPLALLPLADGRSSIVWSADDALAAELLALDAAAFCARLGEASEHALGAILEATPRIGVPLHLLHAREYFAPSLVLVGDAAHAVHPLAGQGVNLGLADVQALVETLTQARRAGRDWSGARTLARYARARKARNLEMLALTDALYRAFRPSLPGLRALLGLGMSALDSAGPLKSWLAQRATGA